MVDGTSLANEGPEPYDAVCGLVLFTINAIFVEWITCHLLLKELGQLLGLLQFAGLKELDVVLGDSQLLDRLI